MRLLYATLLFLSTCCLAKTRGAFKHIAVDFPDGTSQSHINEVKAGIEKSGGVIETEFFLFPGFSARVPATPPEDKTHIYEKAMSALKAYGGRMEEEQEYHAQD